MSYQKTMGLGIDAIPEIGNSPFKGLIL
jgi:hypothetical protein